MPLVIGLTEGQGFDAGGEQFFVTYIHDDFFVLTGPRKTSVGTPESYLVTEDRSAKIRDQIYVSLGLYKNPKIASVAIDAPKEIRISRIGEKE